MPLLEHVVVAINKMDLVDCSREVFDRIEAEYRAFANQIGLENITVMPISGVQGDNIADKSAATPWYAGPTLMYHLETVEIDEQRLQQPFRMPVQWVNRPNRDTGGFVLIDRLTNNTVGAAC